MYRTVVQLFDERVKENPLMVAQYSKNESGRFIANTYIQLQENYRAFALSLRALGVKRGDNVAIISDNRKEWLISDLAILSLGAVDVPRGRDSLAPEIAFIMAKSATKIVISENRAQTDKILSSLDKLPLLERIIVMDDADFITSEDVEILRFSDLLDSGKELLSDSGNLRVIEHEILLGSEEDSATIIFTSGTTGEPKGVVLSHRSFLYQIENISHVHDFKKGEIWLSVLPVWHVFERVIQYFFIYQTETIAYSKPIGKIMLLDIQQINPHYMGSVPRIWETVKAGVEQTLKKKSKLQKNLFSFFLKCAMRYRYWEALYKDLLPKTTKHQFLLKRMISVFPFVMYKPVVALGSKLAFSAVKEKLGKNFIAGVSGGGSMSKDCYEFFNAIGITLLDGYGLTETGPVVSVGTYRNSKIGYMKPLDGTTVKVVNPETGESVAVGEKGELAIKGPQVMNGYYQDQEKTDAIMDKDGFLHTGDLAVLELSGWMRIVGRIKDTIVLSGGENVEPVPIEQALCLSEYIDRAVVVGQDRKNLGALIFINSKAIEHYFKSSSIPYVSRADLSSLEETKNLISREIMRLVSSERGFKSFEEISRFIVLERNFEIGVELSAKQEIKRQKINELYKKEIAGLW